MFFAKHFLGKKDQTELDDILQNLTVLLRTRRGSGYFLENFGLSELSYRTASELAEKMGAEIRETIGLYEPRVEVGSIDEVFDSSRDQAKLVVSLRVRDKGEELRILIDPRTKLVSVVRAKDYVDPNVET